MAELLPGRPHANPKDPALARSHARAAPRKNPISVLGHGLI
jgi:hypothetical protein